MKSITRYCLTLIAIAILSSCDSFLEEKVVSGVSYDFFETKTGMESAVNGAYTTMRWYVGGERYYCFNEYGVDYIWEGADGGQKDAFNKYSVQMNSGHGLLYEFWENNFKGINRINTALMYLPKVVDMTEAEKRSREGELRFMRAYFYYDLVQHFGPIPLNLEGNVTEIVTDFKRAPVADIYQAIITDLRFASEALPDVAQQSQRGRATKWAATNLLAKVYLTRGSAVNDSRGQKATDMDSVIVYANAVISSGKFALTPDYQTFFDQKLHKTTSEVIFAIEFTGEVLFNGDGNKMHLYWVPTYENLPGLQRDLLQGRAWKRVRPTPHFQANIFDRLNDSRLYKMFKWAFPANRESSIPVWQSKYYYIDADGKTTADLLYEPPAELVGKPKFKVGDTAAYFIPKYYGAKDIKGAIISVEADKQMQTDIAKATYTLIPVDNNTNHFYPCLWKWIDVERPDMNYEQGSRNFIRMRFAETYLIAAEAYGRKGDYDKAAEYINVVRKRAAYKEGEIKPKEWTTVDNGAPANLTASTEQEILVTPADISADFIAFMLDERCREMFGEMNRWEDLVRTETLYDRVLKFNPDAAANIKPYHKLRPIPQNHIDRLSPKPPDNEAQNEGYY
ncbi:MAG: RagB/SusD family nutrient uptake outer membrane protein [Tannerellaceae bacterium]|nr:RagB/SusD family nutrient uptake outer membrane protein [Tannerellaceae bacterium]